MAIKIKGQKLINDNGEWADGYNTLTNGDFIPENDNTQQLGKYGNRWQAVNTHNIDAAGDLYVDRHVHFSGSNYNVLIAGEVEINNNVDINANLVTNTLWVNGKSNLYGDVDLGNGYTDEIAVRGTFVNVLDNIKFAGISGDTLNISLEDKSYLTIKRGNTYYCPVLAVTNKHSQTDGHYDCHAQGERGSSRPNHGYANYQGIIGHYTTTTSPTQYLSTCELYDIECLEDGHQPAYMISSNMYGTGGLQETISYQGIL